MIIAKLIILISEIYLSSYVIYCTFLILIAVFFKKQYDMVDKPNTCFAIIIPAHNEELFIKRLLDSISQQDYPKELVHTYVVADNCNDNTSTIAKNEDVRVLEREDKEFHGKGYAIKFALDKINFESIDAIFIIDADSYLDLDALKWLDISIKNGSNAIQCFNGVINTSESWFTNIMDVSRTISNCLFEHAKEIIGLSSHLMGNGMCFQTSIVKEFGWDAFSVGEDWEFFANLIYSGKKISFQKKAKVYHQESRELKQATSQRMRWSSGRILIAYKKGIQIFFTGIALRNFLMVDASLSLLFPNPSMAINLTLITLLVSLIFSIKSFILTATILTFAQICFFLIGILYTQNKLQKLFAMILSPIFLAWKLVIDILSLFGFGRKKWIRTKRSE